MTGVPAAIFDCEGVAAPETANRHVEGRPSRSPRTDGVRGALPTSLRVELDDSLLVDVDDDLVTSG